MNPHMGSRCTVAYLFAKETK